MGVTNFQLPGARGWIIPGKNPDTRIKPLPLTNGHGRYITVTRYTRTDSCVRWGMAVIYSRYKFIAVPLPKRLRNGRFTSETATWIQKWFKIPAGTSRKLYLQA